LDFSNHPQVIMDHTPNFEIGNWNVRSCRAPDKMDDITTALETRKLRLVFLTETFLPGVIERQDAGVYSFYNSGESNIKLRQSGVGFLVDERYVILTNFVPVSPRLATATVQFIDKSTERYSLVVAYAPTEHAGTTAEVESFWSQVSKAVDEAKDTLILSGDFNCQIGNEGYVAADKSCPIGVIPDKALKTTPRGYGVLDWARQRDLVVANTFHNRSGKHLTTWNHPKYTEKRHLKDLFIIKRRTMEEVSDVKATPKGTTGVMTDHALVTMTLIRKCEAVISSNKRKPVIREKWDFAPPGKRRKIQSAELESHLAESLKQVKTEGWEETMRAMSAAVTKVIPKVPREPVTPWYEMCRGELGPLLRQRSMALKKVFLSARNPVAKRKAKRIENRANLEVRKGLKKLRKRYCEEVGLKIQETANERDVRGTFAQVKNLERSLRMPGFRAGPTRKNAPGATTEQHVQNLSDIYNKVTKKETLDPAMLGEKLAVRWDLNGPPTHGEIEKAIKALKTGKAPGTDGLNAEVFKYGGLTLVKRLVKVLAKFWPKQLGEKCDPIPQAWANSKVFPLWKGKGSKKDPSNYRGIFLLDVAGKILARIIAERLKLITEEVLSDSQCGFRPFRSTSHMNMVIRQVQESALDKGAPLAAVFIDLAKCFDSVPRPGTFQVLEHVGVPPNVLSILKQLHTDVEVSVIGGQGKFKMTRGVRQGCTVGPALFNIVYHFIIQQSGLSEGLGVRMERVQEMDGVKFALPADRDLDSTFAVGAFADDIVIVDACPDKLTKALNKLETVSGDLGLHISAKKTELVWLSGRPTTPAPVTLKGVPITESQEFRYLGSLISRDGKIDKEVNAACARGRRALHALAPILRIKSVSLKTKMHLVKARVLPAVFFGAETWATQLSHVTQLNAFLNTVRLRLLGRRRLCPERGTIRNSKLLRKVKGIESASTILARRRLPFIASILHSSPCAATLKSLISEFARSEGRTAGGKRKAHFLKVLRGDCEWLSGLDGAPCLNAFVAACHVGLESPELGEKFVGAGDMIAALKRAAKPMLAVRRGRAFARAWITRVFPKGAERRELPPPKLLTERDRFVFCSEPKCVRTFHRRADMNKHVENDHGLRGQGNPQDKAKYLCIEHRCLRGYASQGWLTKHVDNDHLELRLEMRTLTQN
jgi:uncharacterized C2H2 Zn-finger protein